MRLGNFSKDKKDDGMFLCFRLNFQYWTNTKWVNLRLVKLISVTFTERPI